jgi:cobalt-zinc-cadmium efflux system protein
MDEYILIFRHEDGLKVASPEQTHNHNITSGNAFKTGIIINIIFVIAEALSGYFSNSMALIADAGHNLSDVLALVFSWIAVILSQSLA